MPCSTPHSRRTPLPTELLSTTRVATRPPSPHGEPSLKPTTSSLGPARPHISSSTKIPTSLCGHAPKPLGSSPNEFKHNTIPFTSSIHYHVQRELHTKANHFDDAALDTTPPEPPSTRTQHPYADCNTTAGMIYTDPTSIFLTPSVSCHQYTIVVYEYDGNYIHSESIVDRTGPSIITAYKKAIQYFEFRGFKPLLKRLENEACIPTRPVPLPSTQRHRTRNSHI
jgi:hypothetical protein